MSNETKPSMEEDSRIARRWAKIAGIAALAIAVFIAFNTVIIVLDTRHETPATVLAEACSNYVDAYDNQKDLIEVLQNQVAALEGALDARENQVRLQAELVELLREELADSTPN